MALSSPHVSKTLRDAGFPICQTRTGTGVRVSRSGLPGQVALEVTMPTGGQELRLADRLADWLGTRGAELGLAYERNLEDGAFFRVWRPEDEPDAQALAGARPTLTAQERAHDYSVTLRNAAWALERNIKEGTAPAQADITAARTALAALIELAGGDQ